MAVKDHKLLVVTAQVGKTFDSEEHLEDWLTRIIQGIGMTVAPITHNPRAWYCNDNGNTGYTGVAILTTSHCAIHMWDDVYPMKLEFDLYSCSDFKPADIIPFLEELDWLSMDYKFLDRSNGLKILEG